MAIPAASAEPPGFGTMTDALSALCRDCATAFTAQNERSRCPQCHSPRVIRHKELYTLSLAHIDCDAFFAAVEKLDNPSLQDKPVIVGGGRRGVVAACCYIARTRGVHSAMPMWQAKERCPDAVVVKPKKGRYAEVGRTVKDLMRQTTPLVESLSIDEAFLDLAGTERLHGGSAAAALVKLVKRIENEIGITASIGLSYNKFLAKVASDLDKPRGFAIIGKEEASDFLTDQPVSMLWGVGKSLGEKLKRDGIGTIGQLRTFDEKTLLQRYGSIGSRLYHFSRGKDSRRVEPVSPVKSVSAETTFERDIYAPEQLKEILWPLCERVAEDLRKKGYAGTTATLKLKTASFRQLTRSRKLSDPSRLAETYYRVGVSLLEKEADGTAFRLIGIGASNLVDAAEADLPDLLDEERNKRIGVEQALEIVRDRFGKAALIKGRSLKNRNN